MPNTVVAQAKYEVLSTAALISYCNSILCRYNKKATTKVMLLNEQFQQTKKCKCLQFGSTENRMSGCQGNDTSRPLQHA